MPPRPVCVHHGTSMPLHFFGRAAELTLLDEALAGGAASIVAFVGPGGQGKTALVQHWLEPFLTGPRRAEGVFLWSAYRGKDADVCLRELYAYATNAPAGAVSATYCVDHVLPVLRRERWVLVLDGMEVAQHDGGPWFGRFVHPELGRLLEELAGAPLPGVVVLTSRFPLPQLERRTHARIVSLGGLDPDSARGLLTSLGVRGDAAELDQAAAACGRHAKAVELLGTFLTRYHAGEVGCHRGLPEPPELPEADEEERRVARVLAAFQAALPQEAQDLLALATAFREPPTEVRLLEYLASAPVRTLLHEHWERQYVPFAERGPGWLGAQVEELVQLRLLERIELVQASVSTGPVIDAHPLVRRWFEHALGAAGRRQGASARAGFLRGRPDRRKPASLEEAREEIELFHAHCDAGLWNEADGVLVALDNPKHRFLAPVLERDLLLRFFPSGNWRQPPLWSGFGRYRSLAICFEMIGQYDEALAAYREADAALRGDALLALGRLGPFLERPHVAPPWDPLWQAYRAHALCLAGRVPEAVALARSLVPQDVYEWLHVFECLLRAGALGSLDLRSLLFQAPYQSEQRWADLARRRMRADYLRITAAAPSADLGHEYETLVDAYDRAGLPLERILTRLGYVRWQLACEREREAGVVIAMALELALRSQLPVLAADAWELTADSARAVGNWAGASSATAAAEQLREAVAYRGPVRP